VKPLKISDNPKRMPFYLRTSLSLKAQIDSIAHQKHRDDLEMCVMYRRFINQAESIVEKHGNHEATGYLQKVIQDAKEKYDGHRKRVESK
jgi:hypothetical protein